MTASRDASIAAEYAAGSAVADICARWAVTPLYVDRIVQDATVARPAPRLGLQSTGNRVLLAAAVGVLVGATVHTLPLAIGAAVVSFLIATAVARR